MLTPEQIEARRSGLGGSDAAAALGLSRRRTPLAVYLEKVDPAALPVQETPEWLRWRSLMEAPVRLEWALRNSRAIVVPPMLRSEQYPWMVAHVDGLVENEDAGVEIKTVAGPAVEEWGEPGTDEIPTEYLVQVVHYMIVTGRARWYVPALFNASELRTYVVERPAAGVLDRLVELERQFWQLVQERTPPPIRTNDDAAAMWPRDRGTRITATEEIETRLQRLHAWEQQGAQCEKAAEIERAAIKAYMADNATLVDQEGRALVTWKRSKDSARIDVDRLRAEQPTIAAQFSRSQAGARKFLLK